MPSRPGPTAAEQEVILRAWKLLEAWEQDGKHGDHEPIFDRNSVLRRTIAAENMLKAAVRDLAASRSRYKDQV